MDHGYGVWVDGGYLSAWPDENYYAHTFKTPLGTIVEDALIFATKEEAHRVADALKAEYQWEHADEMIRVIELWKEMMWVEDRGDGQPLPEGE